jgi:MFS transporter, DHA1 family, tetracycline resistance protein
VKEERLATVGLVCMFLGLGGLAAIAFAGYAAGFSAETVSGFAGLFYCSTAVAVFGFAFVNPSVTSLVSRNADPSRQGEILGVNQSFAALGRILGPLCGSVVFYQHPSRSLPFLVAGGVLVAVMFLLVGYAKNKPAEGEKP